MDVDLLSFPTLYEIKVIGINNENFISEIVELLRDEIPNLNQCISINYSNKKTYITLNINTTIFSLQSLNSIYTKIKKHKDVKFIL